MEVNCGGFQLPTSSIRMNRTVELGVVKVTAPYFFYKSSESDPEGRGSKWSREKKNTLRGTKRKIERKGSSKNQRQRPRLQLVKKRILRILKASTHLFLFFCKLKVRR